MNIWVLIIALVLPASAMADSCVHLEGATLINKCSKCMEVTIRALRPPPEQHISVFAGENRSLRLEPGAQTTVPGHERSAIVDLKECQ
jgi:hypothetical protein